MGRRGKACFCETTCTACGKTIISDGTVTWISHTVSDGVITRVENEANCVTYYVDSVSGGGAETGTGTEEDPWTNLNTVFSDSCINSICTTSGCPMVKVLVRGTVDYSIADDNHGPYGRNLIIEPWDDEQIVIGNSGSICNVGSVDGVVLKNITLTDGGFISANSTFQNCIANSVSGWALHAFGTCYGSVFDGCIGNATAGGAGYDFYYCSNSTFNNCTCLGHGITHCYMVVWYNGNFSGQQEYSNALVSGSSGTFTNCTTIIGSLCGAGYYDCSCVFTNCTVTGVCSATSANSAIGFMSCNGSTFNSCVVEITLTSSNASDCATLTVYGWSGCSDSIFNSCLATAIVAGNGTNRYGCFAVAFEGNCSSAFTSCVATANATITNGGCAFACGFYRNTLGLFSDCSTTNKVCSVVSGGCYNCYQCAGWSCDI